MIWRGEGEPPDGLADTEFLVAPYMGPALDAAALAEMPRLRVIQLFSAGFETWLPLVPDGVTLCNGRGVHGGSTAELAVAGVLALVRELPHFLDEQRAGRWSPKQTEGTNGKRVLVLGAGDIGRRVATALGAFGAEPILVARTARDGVHAVAELPDLLPQAQIVVLALPATGETRGLVDADFLAALPDGAVVANVARGPIIDTDALLAELTAGRLKAFLDVTEPEPLPAGHPLWSAPNLVLTPHIGGGTHGWQQRGFALVRAQLDRYLAGEPLENVVG